MALSENTIVVGLTGAFGRGSSTFSETLEDSLEFARLKISDLIREEWASRNEDAGGQRKLNTLPRGALQDLGDELRHSEGLPYWVERAVDRIAGSTDVVMQLVLDGIRNPGEVEWLRRRFKNFFLVAIDTGPSERFERLKITDAWKGNSWEDYIRISSRDIEAPQNYGQRVQQCVDLADYVITNDQKQYPPGVKNYFVGKAEDLLNLVQGPYRRPTDMEYFMHLAVTTASGSACLKRQVGAVVIRPGEKRKLGPDKELQEASRPIGVGYNENPDFMQPCYLEYRACFRDIWRSEQWDAINPKKCPHCGSSLTGVKWPYNCPNPACNSGSLLETFFPERAMTKCTAIHAEARAIWAARGPDLRGAHLYCTTLPCFLCAEQILQSGIQQVVYVEPYPDQKSQDLLQDHGVVLRRFEGVKSLAYVRFFGPWRPSAESKHAISST